MPSPTDDNDLRALFAALRQEEAGRAPAFDALWDRAVDQAGRRPQRLRWIRYAAVAVLLAGLGGLAVLTLRPEDPAPVAAITAWRSPTASLLRPPLSAADPLPTSSLLTPPGPHLETYVPTTRLFWPGGAPTPDKNL